MAHLFIQHEVADYDAWRPVLDGDTSGREAAGARDVAVLRDVDNPNSVRMVIEADPAIGEPMMSDPQRAEKMQEAGVVTPSSLGELNPASGTGCVNGSASAIW